MNLLADHPLQANDLIKISNLIGEAGKPVIPFIWKQPPAVPSQKIQVEDQRIDLAGNPVGDWVKCSIYMPVYGISNTTLSQFLFALKHAYGFFQYMKSMQFYNPRKRCELFAYSVIDTAATCWEKVTHDFVQVASFQESLECFRSCLQKWVKAYLGKGSCRKHFAFMQALGSLVQAFCLYASQGLACPE